MSPMYGRYWRAIAILGLIILALWGIWSAGSSMGNVLATYLYGRG